MPRKLKPTNTLETFEEEFIFTLAALIADPDAAEFADRVEAAFARIDAQREADRELRKLVAQAQAKRSVANIRLDPPTQQFATLKWLEAEKKPSSATWRRFFTEKDRPASFIRRPFREQLALMTAWLGQSDALLEKFLDEFKRWVGLGNEGIAEGDAIRGRRGEVLAAKEELAEDLTRLRDGLHAELVVRAQERGLARDWANAFFRTESRETAGSAAEKQTETVKETETAVA